MLILSIKLLKNLDESQVNKFKDNIKQNELIDFIDKLNNDSSIHGILVQLPLPSHLNSDKILNSINPIKDVDGFHPMNLVCLKGNPSFIPCTPYGCLEILKYYNIDVKSKVLLLLEEVIL